MADPVLGNIHLQLRSGLVVRNVARGAPLYWRQTAPAAAPVGRRSAKAVISGDLALSAGSLLTDKGNDVAAFSFPGSGATPASGSTATGFLPGKGFVSRALAAQTIPEQLWTFAAAGLDASAQGTGFAAALYVWRPSDDSVQMIYDGAAVLGSAWAFAANTGAVGGFVGAEVTALEGDALVLEVYQNIVSATAPDGTAWEVAASARYDGAEDVVDGATVSFNPASMIRPSLPLVFP